MMEKQRDDKITQLLIMVERFENRFVSMDGRLQRIEEKTDGLHMIVAGNGDPGSVIMRQTAVERRLDDVENELEKMCNAAERRQIKTDKWRETMTRQNDIIEKQIDAWRNRLIGIGLVLTFFGGAIALFGRALIAAVITP